MNYKEAKITLDYQCNNNCIFCYEKGNRNIESKTTEEVKEEIKAVVKDGYDSIHFIGGEPSIRDDIIELIKYAKSLEIECVMMTTNGRRFCYNDFAEAVIKAGLNQVIFSIHGHNSEVHDKIIQVEGGFAQMIKGIVNLKKLGFNGIGTNTTICKLNYRYLENIAEILKKFGIKRAEFIYAIDMTNNNFKSISPRVSEFSSFCKKAIDLGKQNNFNWILLNPPMCCVFEKYLDRIRYGDSSDEKLYVNKEKYKKYFNLNKKKVIKYLKLENCQSCLLNDKCQGINKEYFENYGQTEICPVKVV